MSASMIHEDYRRFFLSSLLLLLYVAPSSSKELLDVFFPNTKVTMRNSANSTVFYMCSLSEDMKKLEPQESVAWSFRQIFAPAHWCYVSIKEDLQGFFWVYTMQKKCRNCLWVIKDDGVYFLENKSNQLEKHHLWVKYADDDDVETKNCSESCQKLPLT